MFGRKRNDWDGVEIAFEHDLDQRIATRLRDARVQRERENACWLGVYLLILLGWGAIWAYFGVGPIPHEPTIALVWILLFFEGMRRAVRQNA